MTKAQQDHLNSASSLLSTQDSGISGSVSSLSNTHSNGSGVGNATSGFHSYASGDVNKTPSNNVLSDSASSSQSLLGNSFSSQPNSKFTLDSERAQFAASAVCVTSSASQQTAVTSANSVQVRIRVLFAFYECRYVITVIEFH